MLSPRFSSLFAGKYTGSWQGGADYRPSEEKWVQVGYLMMGIQFEDSSGQTRFDMRIMGPMAAIRLDFFIKIFSVHPGNEYLFSSGFK